MFVLLYLPIVRIQSVTLPVYNEANDVKKTVDNVLVDTGDYASEIDIYVEYQRLESNFTLRKQAGNQRR